MIIPALVRYYDRLVAEGDDDLAPLGYSRQQVSFKVVLNKNGTLHGIERESVTITETRPKKTKDGTVDVTTTKERPKPVLVCGQTKPTGSGLNPCFLWDNASYMLGFETKEQNPGRTEKSFKAFRDRHLALRDQIKDDGFKAVCSFLESWRPSDARAHKDLGDIATNFGVFQMRGDAQYVHERPGVKRWWEDVGMAGEAEEDEQPKKPMKGATRKTSSKGASALNKPLAASAPAEPVVHSLVNGEPQAIARLHEPRIKGVQGSQTSGATIVSFNQDSFTSYGKEQGDNAPVGVEDAFKYCTALNRLTGSDANRVRLAGDTLVFWSEKQVPIADGLDFDNAFAMSTGDSKKWNEERARQAYERAVRGEADDLDRAATSTPFYILGLSPNISRLSVRIWHVSTVGDVLTNVRSHVSDLQMLPAPEDAPPLTIRRLINETASPKSGWADEESVSPLLYPETLRAVIAGGPFPSGLLAGVLSRVRTEGLADSETRTDWRQAQHRRCAIIRACLLRQARQTQTPLEVPVSLDETRTDTPYLLGRLFAVLEKIQQNALGEKLNRTIKDSYFGSACTTPAGVFPRLLRLTQHHLNKIEFPGQRIARDKELGVVMSSLSTFPTLLSMKDQGLFAIGYYHQKQSYVTKRDADAPPAA